MPLTVNESAARRQGLDPAAPIPRGTDALPEGSSPTFVATDADAPEVPPADRGEVTPSTTAGEPGTPAGEAAPAPTADGAA